MQYTSVMDFPLEDMDDLEFNRRFGFSRLAPHTRATWMPSDKESTWMDNQDDPITRERLARCGWTADNIQYRYNNYGFRSDDDFEVGSSGGVIYLGCSLTEGIGLNVEDTWAYRMHANLGGRFYNLGQSATGIETQYRLMRAWVPMLRPSAVLTLGAIGPRRELLGDTGTLVIGPWMDAYDVGHTEHALMGELEHAISTQRTLDAMRHVAMRFGVPLYMPSRETAGRAFAARSPDDCARDGIHWGRGWHAEMGRDLRGWERIS